MNQEVIAKIAESSAEKIIASRQEEIKRSAIEGAKQSLAVLITQEVAFATQSISSSIENSARLAAENAINQAIPSIVDQVLPKVEASIQAAIKGVEDNIAELSRRLEEISSSIEEKPQESNFNYEVEAPDGSKSGALMEINFDSTDLHVLGLKEGKLYWIETEDCA